MSDDVESQVGPLVIGPEEGVTLEAGGNGSR